jgi:hypothetical protein
MGKIQPGCLGPQQPFIIHGTGEIAPKNTYFLVARPGNEHGGMVENHSPQKKILSGRDFMTLPVAGTFPNLNIPENHIGVRFTVSFDGMTDGILTVPVTCVDYAYKIARAKGDTFVKGIADTLVRLTQPISHHPLILFYYFDGSVLGTAIDNNVFDIVIVLIQDTQNGLFEAILSIADNGNDTYQRLGFDRSVAALIQKATSSLNPVPMGWEEAITLDRRERRIVEYSFR